MLSSSDRDERDVRPGRGRTRGGDDPQVVGLELDVADETEQPERAGQQRRGDRDRRQTKRRFFFEVWASVLVRDGVLREAG